MTRSEAGRLGWEKSKDARARIYQKMREEYYNNPNRCKQCNKILEYRNKSNKFCNHTCSAKYTNKRRKSRLVYIKCLNCGKNTANLRFCSTTCHKEFKFKQASKDIEAGFKVSKHILKKYLIAKDDRCSICGITEWNCKPLTLDLDHIDGNSDNDSLDNVRLLCPNCHSQTDTYKGKNAGNGRYSRRERYRLGKSY